MTALSEFWKAALPWLCIGISIAFCAAMFHRHPHKTQEYTRSETYAGECMCFGICCGLMLGTQYLIYGLLLGLVIGMCI